MGGPPRAGRSRSILQDLGHFRPSRLLRRHKHNILLPSSNQPKSTRWPHQDQDFRIREFQYAHGMINLIENGPQDGGLVVMKGGNTLNNEFFKTRSMEKEKLGKGPDD